MFYENEGFLPYIFKRQFPNKFPDNKQSEFTVRLDHPIHIEEERWEAALLEIATPSEVLNITEENTFFFFFFWHFLTSAFQAG